MTSLHDYFECSPPIKSNPLYHGDPGGCLGGPGWGEGGGVSCRGVEVLSVLFPYYSIFEYLFSRSSNTFTPSDEGFRKRRDMRETNYGETEFEVPGGGG